jgi:hypothetical protein
MLRASRIVFSLLGSTVQAPGSACGIGAKGGRGYPVNSRVLVSIQVPAGSGERRDGVAADRGGEDFAEVGEERAPRRRQVIEAESSRSMVCSPCSDWLPSDRPLSERR